MKVQLKIEVEGTEDAIQTWVDETCSLTKVYELEYVNPVIAYVLISLDGEEVV